MKGCRQLPFNTCLYNDTLMVVAFVFLSLSLSVLLLLLSLLAPLSCFALTLTEVLSRCLYLKSRALKSLIYNCSLLKVELCEFKNVFQR